LIFFRRASGRFSFSLNGRVATRTTSSRRSAFAGIQQPPAGILKVSSFPGSSRLAKSALFLPATFLVYNTHFYRYFAVPFCFAGFFFCWCSDFLGHACLL
jgi:hypothetical protein